MKDYVKIAVAPPVQEGGSLFTPKQLVTIGNLAGPEAAVEMTGFKQLYVEVPREDEAGIRRELESSGLEVYPAGFVTKSLIACQFCKGAEEAGLNTAKALNLAIAGIETPAPLKIGYAGCALGTSEPLLKDIGVVKMRDTFDIYVGGDPKGLKAKFASKLLTGIREQDLIKAVMELIHFYKTNAKPKEKFSRFVDRISLERLKALFENMEVVT